MPIPEWLLSDVRSAHAHFRQIEEQWLAVDKDAKPTVEIHNLASKFWHSQAQFNLQTTTFLFACMQRDGKTYNEAYAALHRVFAGKAPYDDAQS